MFVLVTSENVFANVSYYHLIANQCRVCRVFMFICYNAIQAHKTNVPLPTHDVINLCMGHFEIVRQTFSF